MAALAFAPAVPLALTSRGSTRRVARARARVVSAARPDPGGGQAAGARGRVAPLLVTSTNDLVDAVLTRALHAPVDPDARPREGGGTHRAHDADLLDALAHRAPELTGSEAADLLWAVSCAPRFSTLPRNATGRLLDALVHREGPFAPLHKLYLDESLPLAWMRPTPRRPPPPPARRRRARARRRPVEPDEHARDEPTAPARERPDDETDDEADVHADLDYKTTNEDAWSGPPPRAGWRMPYDYSARDVARVAHALASFPPPVDQTAADDRALTARAVAHLTARFSRDERTREETPAEMFALLAWRCPPRSRPETRRAATIFADPSIFARRRDARCANSPRPFVATRTISPRGRSSRWCARTRRRTTIVGSFATILSTIPSTIPPTIRASPAPTAEPPRITCSRR